jgi:hypothetical protein
MRIYHLFCLQVKEYHHKLFQNKSKLKYLILLLIGILGLSVVFKAGLSYFFQTFLLSVNQIIIGDIIGLLIIIATILGIFGFLKGVYFCKDSAFLASLPLSTKQIYFAKFLTILFDELLSSLLFCLPILIALGLDNFPITYFMAIPIILVLISLIGLGIASMLVVPIILIVQSIKKNPLFVALVLIVVFYIVFYFYMKILEKLFVTFDLINQTNESIANITNSLRSIYYSVPGLDMLTSILFNHNTILYAVILFIVVSIIIIFGVFFNSYLYKNLSHFPSFKLHLAKSSAVLESNQTSVKSKGTLFKIIKKDILLLSRSSNLFFQHFLYALLMPIIIYTYNRLLNIGNLGTRGVGMILGANVLVFCLIGLMSCTYSANATSGEGHNFYLLKLTSLKPSYFAISKIIINVSINSVSCLLSLIICLLNSFISPLSALLIFIMFVLLVSGHCIASYEYDLRKPLFGSTNLSKSENTPIIQKSLVLGCLLGGVLGITSLVLTIYELNTLTYIFMLVTSLFYFSLRLWLLTTRLNYYFDRVEV